MELSCTEFSLYNEFSLDRIVRTELFLQNFDAGVDIYFSIIAYIFFLYSRNWCERKPSIKGFSQKFL